jgi:hypothetical protein
VTTTARLYISDSDDSDESDSESTSSKDSTDRCGDVDEDSDGSSSSGSSLASVSGSSDDSGADNPLNSRKNTPPKASSPTKIAAADRPSPYTDDDTDKARRRHGNAHNHGKAAAAGSTSRQASRGADKQTSQKEKHALSPYLDSPHLGKPPQTGLHAIPKSGKAALHATTKSDKSHGTQLG